MFIGLSILIILKYLDTYECISDNVNGSTFNDTEEVIAADIISSVFSARHFNISLFDN